MSTFNYVLEVEENWQVSGKKGSDKKVGMKWQGRGK
jgi:hypothetical protein